jgi:membrane associated rhomboid family serine protease
VIPLRDANPTRRTPLVTLSLIGACFVVFAGELGVLASGGQAALDAFITRWGVVPAELTAAWRAGDYLSTETATLVTSQFLHGGWFHLLGNMWFLYVFGNNVEDAMGHLRFFIFYMVTGLGAAAAQVLAGPGSAVPMVGASGAISGVMGAYVILYPLVRVHTLVFLGFLVTRVALPAYLMLGYWFLIQILGGLPKLAGGAAGGVAFWAHVGGFVAGALLVPLFKDKVLLARHRRARYFSGARSRAF